MDMSEVGWRDDLATGVEWADRAHKRLFGLLDGIADARRRGNLIEAATATARFLEAFSQHFDEESDYLRALDPDGFFNLQQDFVSARAVLAMQPVGADDVELIDQSAHYARAWLLDHIVRQSRLCGQGASGRKGLWLRYDKLKLQWRIVLLAIVPLLLACGLVLSVIDELRLSMNKMELLLKINDLNAQVGKLVFDLETERGLAVMAGANPVKFREQFVRQVEKTDFAHGKFDLSVAAIFDQLPGESAKHRIEDAVSSLDIIPEIRGDVNIGSFDGITSLDIYTTAITDLTNIVPEIVRTIAPSDFTKNNIAYVLLLQTKELASLERAIGTAILSHSSPIYFSRRSVKTLANQQAALMESFLAIAPHEISENYQRTNRHAFYAMGWMRDELENGVIVNLTLHDWFEATSRHLERFEEIENKLTAQLQNDADALQRQATSRAIVLGGGLLALSLVSLGMVGILAWTILTPLKELLGAVHHLARGDYTSRVPRLDAKDEVGDIARAMHKLKESLAHSGLLSARQWTKNAERLRLIADNFPGIVFRVEQKGGAVATFACVSRRLRQIAGISPDTIIDKPIIYLLRRLMKPQDCHAFLQVMRKSKAKQIDFEFFLRGADDDGGRWMRVLATPFFLGETCIWDGVALDISSIRQAETEQNRVSAELGRLHRKITAASLANDFGKEIAALIRPVLASTGNAIASLPDDSQKRADLLVALASARKISLAADRWTALHSQHDDFSSGIEFDKAIEATFGRIADDLPKNVIPKLDLSCAGDAVFLSSSETEQLLLQLSENAAKALSRRAATLLISTKRVGNEKLIRLQVSCCLTIVNEGSDDPPPDNSMADLAVLRRDAVAITLSRAIVECSGGWLDVIRKPSAGILFDVYLPIQDIRHDNIIHLRKGTG